MPIQDAISSAPNSSIPNRYGAMCTEVYDLDKPPGSLHDIDYYRDRLAQADGPILEAACGTGRLLIPLMEAGLRVDGFDQSHDMLDSCARHCAARGLTPSLKRARFQDFAYDHDFAAAVIPVGTFTLIDDFAVAFAVLRRVFDHLKPGGRLYIDIPPLAYLTNERPDVRTWTAENGDVLRIEGRAVEIDLLSQRRVTHDRYERWRNGRLVESELEVMAFRLWGLKELELLLTAAGFDEVTVRADYQAGPPRRSSRILNYEARRPA